MKLRPDGASCAVQRRWQWISVGNGWQNGVESQLTGVLCEILMWESVELKVSSLFWVVDCLIGIANFQTVTNISFAKNKFVQ